MKQAPDGWLTRQETAKRLAISVRSLDRLLPSFNETETIRYYNKRIFKKEGIERVLNEILNQ